MLARQSHVQSPAFLLKVFQVFADVKDPRIDNTNSLWDGFIIQLRRQLQMFRKYWKGETFLWVRYLISRWWYERGLFSRNVDVMIQSDIKLVNTTDINVLSLGLLPAKSLYVCVCLFFSLFLHARNRSESYVVFTKLDPVVFLPPPPHFLPQMLESGVG